MKVLIADDHQIVRYGIKLMLQNKYRQVDFDECESVKEVIACVRQKDYDFLFLDIHMVDTISVSVIQSLILLKPTVRIIILSQLPEAIFGLHFIKAGAKAYIDKKRNFDVLEKVIDWVAEGKVFVTEEIRDQMLRDSFSRGGNSTRLSGREIDVLSLMLDGYTTSGIAERLNLRSTTVSTYKGRIFEKLNTSNLFELRALRDIIDIVKE